VTRVAASAAASPSLSLPLIQAKTRSSRAPRYNSGAMATPTGPATLPREEQEQEQRSKPRALEPYKVVLHNDDHNSMDHVVRSLMKSVPGLGATKAVKIMLEAHNNGKAVVIVCPLEPAELYRDRLQSFGLTATIEPA
jgi:ATP-dependent Clp protease adaptor protein ClpS